MFSGVFERYPDLKYVVTEAAAYWAADMMWKWDQYMGGGHTTKKMAALLKGKISKLPSDYFGENIDPGASTMSKEEIRRRHVLGCDVVMWGTDYPHPEGTWPHTQERLRGDFAAIPVEHARSCWVRPRPAATASTWVPCDRSPTASAPRRRTWARTPADGRTPRRCGAARSVEGRVPGASARLSPYAP